MGKGDRKTAKGKRNISSYGNARTHAVATRAGGARFRGTILSRGGAIDFAEAYREFRGRDKDISPLLERRGLAGAGVTAG